jgi:hypothetical protein
VNIVHVDVLTYIESRYYISFYNSLKQILKCGGLITPFMFINICWKKDNEVFKSLMPMNKASVLVQELERKGIKTWFEMELQNRNS